MCFYTSLFAKGKIAQEDIIVWKTGYKREDKDTFRSPTQDYVYRLNVLQSRIKIKKELECIDLSGISLVINAGYHSYVNEPISEFRYQSEVVVKCIIPKGTVYYTNGSVNVSETIIAIKIV
jgi:hypothetical protein